MDPVTGHIRAVASRSPAETDALVTGLHARAWPGGGDRHEPVASEWLRRWSPRAMGPVAAGCACASGRCGTCN